MAFDILKGLFICTVVTNNFQKGVRNSLIGVTLKIIHAAINRLIFLQHKLYADHAIRIRVALRIIINRYMRDGEVVVRARVMRETAKLLSTT